MESRFIKLDLFFMCIQDKLQTGKTFKCKTMKHLRTKGIPPYRVKTLP